MKTRNQVHRPNQLQSAAGAALLAAMAAASALGQSPEILVNGHFELPAMSGAGDVWSSSAAFSLPGWTYPTGSNQCYLEFGRPLGSARYSDGRQAVCLHGQGTPVSLSQTFPTMPGANYTVSFAQSDEANAGPSPSQLSVGVAGLMRIFPNLGGYHVYDDHGYKVRAFSFTARSNLTTLTFTDTSPAGVPSPLIDGVCVNQSSGPVAGTSLPGQGGSNQFFNLGTPAVSANLSQYSVAYIGVGSGGSSGVCVDDDYCGTGIPHLHWPGPPPPIWLVDNTVSIPGGVGTFQNFSPGSSVELNPQPLPPVVVNGDNAFFWAGGSGGQQGLYTVDGLSSGKAGMVQQLADFQTPMPGHNGNFVNFSPMFNGTNYPAQFDAAGGNFAFWGQGADDWDGVYCGTFIPHHIGPPQQLNRVADRGTLIPGTTFTFGTFVNPAQAQEPDPHPWRQVAIRGNNIVFFGASAAALGLQGLFCAPVPVAGAPSNQLFTVVDTSVPVPGATNKFNGFGSFDCAASASATRLNVAFIGTGSGGQAGVYDDDDVPYCGNGVIPIPFPGPGPIWTVADLNTPIPQGVGNFTGFMSVACGGPYGISIAFVGLGANGQKGIYATPPAGPSGTPAIPMAKIIDLNDTIDGKTLADLQLAPGAVDGFVLAYKAVFTDGSQGLYVTPLIDNVAVTSSTLSGSDVQLTFTAPPSRNYTIVSGTDATHHGTNEVSGAMGNGGSANCIVPGGFSRSNQGYFYSVKWNGADPGDPQFNGTPTH